MALKSTIFKAGVQLADIDHGCYTDLQLTLARHPSETDERVMVRLAALALNAHQVQDLCGGDARIGFGAGLLREQTDRLRAWARNRPPPRRKEFRKNNLNIFIGIYLP